MALAIGSRLGAYEITGLLGAGGMGEVYKARDLRLNRFVALKILPGTAALDPERRERFEREAQAIAALNHPNIVTIYSVERIASGASAGPDVLCITMELVEGRSLAEAMPAGGFPLDRLLAIAIPIVEAIAAAHQKGITHRDLKPANVLIGDGEHAGRIKVLDFGLAKLKGTAPSADSLTGGPTGVITGDGRILGTVAYMSPEQAEGKPIDARSDLFSIGVVLYEMATGTRPFSGDTNVSTISSIVKDTPKSVTELKPALPRELGRIVRHALVKDPERRYQTAKDLRNDLEELKSALDSGELARDSVHAAPGTPASAWRWAAIGLAGIAITATAAVVKWRGGVAPSTAPSSIRMMPLTSGVNAMHPAISPDGKYVAYVRDDRGLESVWVHQIASNSDARIVDAVPGTEISGLTVTPDGGFVDFLRGEDRNNCSLYRVAFLGGAARRIVDHAASAPGWSPDGRRMAFLDQEIDQSERRLVVADADGTHARVVARRRLPLRYLTVTYANNPDYRPVWLPDGASVILVGADEARGNESQIVKVDLATGNETILMNNRANGGGPGQSLALAPDGRSFVRNAVTDDGFMQVVRETPSGGVTQLTNDLDQYSGVSVAADSLVTARREVRTSLTILDAAGRELSEAGRELPAQMNGLAWSGTDRLLYAAALSGGAGLWSVDLRTGASSFLVAGAANPSTNADGSVLVFTQDATRTLWRAESDGSHAAVIAKGVSGHLTPDGHRVFYQSGQSGIQTQWTLELPVGTPHEFEHRYVISQGIDVSPDGKFVLLVGRDNGSRSELRVLPVDGGQALHTVAVPNTRWKWMPDSRSIAYLDSDAAPSNIWVQPLDGSAPHQLTHFTDRRIERFAWSPDGTRLAVARAAETSDIVLLKGIR